MKKDDLGLEPYKKPTAKIFTLAGTLSFLEEGFSGTFAPDEIDLDGMEGDQDDNF